MSARDTIFALSSGALPSGLAVVRVAGPEVGAVLEKMAGGAPADRVAALRTIRSPEGDVLDRGLVLFFAGDRSFVGEDTVELHLHGGRAVVAAVLGGLGRMPGLRAAEAGEFSKRAFLNGKLDLLEVEALADLVQAETDYQRRFAQSGAGAAQGRLYEGWRSSLIRARALLEAGVDFADEDDVPDDTTTALWGLISRLSAEIEQHMAGFERAAMIRDGFDVVIIGPPNAGKSSLLNRLAQREAAIVTDEPGTTRDPVEVVLDVEGMKVRITDTAGIREPTGRVEAIGIDRALQRAREADLVLEMHAAADPAVPPVAGGYRRTIRLVSKCDLIAESSGGMWPGLRISSMTGNGLDALLSEIAAAARNAIGDAGQVLPSRRRHLDNLVEASGWLKRALAGPREQIELRAEEIRLAGEALGRITGAVGVEDLLDVIFAEFCIGK